MKKLLLFITAILTFYSCSNDDSQKLLDEQSKSLESGFDLIERDLHRLERELVYRLSDEAKNKYIPIRIWVEKTRDEFLEIYDWIKESEKLIDKNSFIWSERMNQMNSLFEDLSLKQKNSFLEIMTKHGRTFGLKEDGIKKRVGENESSFDVLNNIKNLWSENKDREESFKNVVIKTKYDVKILEFELIERMAELTTGRAFICNFGFSPLIFSNQNIVKRGEVFKADISIHPYDHGIFQSDIEFKINGKIADFSKSRYVKYVSEPILKKQESIIISCKIRNSNSGKFETAFPDYEYIINTIE